MSDSDPGHNVGDKANIGGWIAGAGAGFDNARDFRAIADIAREPLDPDRRRYFRKYLDGYFQEPFVHGWGTEDVLACIEESAPIGDWLDLGAGTTSLLWAIPMTGLRSVTCCDLVPEALSVLDDLVRSEAVPRLLADVLAMYDLDEDTLRRKRGMFARYLIFDALQPWPPQLSAATFDFITAVGIFGLAPTPAEYKQCFRYMAPHLAEGGAVVGADWVRSRAFIEEEGHDNSYVGEAMLREAAAEAGLTVKACRPRALAGDPLYDAIVVWSLGR